MSKAHGTGSKEPVVEEVREEEIQAQEVAAHAPMILEDDEDEEDLGPQTYVYQEPEDETVAFIARMMSDETPDIEFMLEHVLSHELDPVKRRKFEEYAKTLDADAMQALWESFKGTFGASPNTITSNQMVADHIKLVEDSRTLQLRNSDAKSELHRLGTVASQLSRALKTSSSDGPLASFRVDNVYAHIASLNRDVTMMNSAIIAMAEMLLIGYDTQTGVDMAVNAERAAKICAIVGYSAKGWANVHDVALAQSKKAKAENDALTLALKTANETIASLQNTIHAERTRVENLTVNAGTYFIGNHSGNYITTVNREDEAEGGVFRIGPYNLRITQDRLEAFTFHDVETAKQVFDGLQDWGKRNLRVRQLLKSSGVALSSLFIGAESLVKVR